MLSAQLINLQHPDLIEKQRRVFSEAIKVYAAAAPAPAAVAATEEDRAAVAARAGD